MMKTVVTNAVYVAMGAAKYSSQSEINEIRLFNIEEYYQD